MVEATRVRIGHSPDPDDAFMFHAMTTGRFDTSPYEYEHVLLDIETLNQKALEGEFEVSAVSIHALPDVLDTYALMNCGASMGEGYGPRIVTKGVKSIEEVKTGTIAIPGIKTSAHLALRIMLGEMKTTVIPFDEIMDAVKVGKVDAGLIIHEGQLTWESEGLHLVADLGEMWAERTGGLPLPLGGNVVRRDLGKEECKLVTEHVKISIQNAISNPEEGLAFAIEWGRGIDEETNEEFVQMYVNERTIDYGPEGRKSVRLFLKEGQRIGMIREDLDVDALEFIGAE
ncbi:MAG: MqnA/MqnD/SBP family protein [Candidatus Thermoplasmatota archaeon]|nr:MqnA/MqnD/SBP family protein [Candidatus Thermoplasmatota archaeon]|tara:strand:+ start:1311 stop:2168 length:858 start_codon:yes stop_codon:yes gene_type:complete